MKLDKNTYGTVVLIYVLSAVGIFLSLRFIPQWWIKWPLSLFLLWLSGWQTYFHMVPDRKPVGSDHLVSAVSDGKIAVTAASCPDADCVRCGPQNSGPPIVCLPNRVSIRFSENGEVDGAVR